jgi:hypothetical protein
MNTSISAQNLLNTLSKNVYVIPSLSQIGTNINSDHLDHNKTY